MKGDAYALVIGCAAACTAVKLVGPIVLGGRPLPGAFSRLVALLAPALLAALVVTETFSHEREVVVDASAAGVAAGGLTAWRTRSEVAAVLVAAAVAGGVRAL